MEIKKTNQYQWNPGFVGPIAHTDITKVIDELSEIQEIYGSITTAIVVESSKNKKSVLHSYFEWDNEKAGAKWREQQAGTLLRRIEVVVIKDGNPIPVRVYEVSKRNIYGDSSAEYKHVDTLSEKELQNVRSYIIKDLLRIKGRLESIELYARAASHIENAIAEIENSPVESIGAALSSAV